MFVIAQALVYLRVIDLDHRFIDGDGMGHPDRFGKQADQPTADIGLAGTRRPVNHDGAPGIQGNTQLIEHALRQHHRTETVVHVMGADTPVVNGLQLQQRAVGTHRVRRCTYVATAGQGIAGTVAAALGQAVAHGLPPGLTQYFNATVLAQEREDFFHHRTGERQSRHQLHHVQHTRIV